MAESCDDVLEHGLSAFACAVQALLPSYELCWGTWIQAIAFRRGVGVYHRDMMLETMLEGQSARQLRRTSSHKTPSETHPSSLIVTQISCACV